MATRLIIFLGVSSASVAFCQDYTTPDANGNSVLRKFEKSVQPRPGNPAESSPPPAPRNREVHDDLGDRLANELVNTAMDVVADLGEFTMQRVSPEADAALRRNDGDILIPFVRYDFAYQDVSANIFANSHRLEAGYGPFALLLEDYTFHEQLPADTLTISRQLLLYRMSANRMIEVDFGLGQSIISDAQHTTLNSISLPVRLLVSENVALELRPTWSETMDDYEIALHWGRQFGSVTIGYRTLISPGETLGGPFAGFAVYY